MPTKDEAARPQGSRNAFDMAPRRGPSGNRVRNAELRLRYHGGERISALARAFNMTHQRVCQVLGCNKRTLDMRGMLRRR